MKLKAGRFKNVLPLCSTIPNQNNLNVLTGLDGTCEQKPDHKHTMYLHTWGVHNGKGQSMELKEVWLPLGRRWKPVGL